MNWNNIGKIYLIPNYKKCMVCGLYFHGDGFMCNKCFVNSIVVYNVMAKSDNSVEPTSIN